MRLHSGALLFQSKIGLFFLCRENLDTVLLMCLWFWHRLPAPC